MNTTRFSIFAGTLIGLLIALGLSLSIQYEPRLRPSGAGLAMDHWAFVRSYPGTTIPMDRFAAAFAIKQGQQASSTEGSAAYWEALGPKNIGGRTLCIAFNPANPNTIYAGSASGGLWVSHSAGVGVEAWEQVPTGFPVLGVMSIAIAPDDSNTIYIGTGEVYGHQRAAPGVVDRTTRGSYGIGILKSIDGGMSWTYSLNWAYGDLRGVHAIEINPLRPQTIYAATTEGLYRSRDGGDSWQNIHPVIMAVDLDLHPTDTSILYVSHGNFGSTGHGLYRSTDAGGSFVKLQGGLPVSFQGMPRLTINKNNPSVLYASITDKFIQLGLYRSADGGDSWTLKNTEDVAKYQGWYSHDMISDPAADSTVIFVGINCWKSTDAGLTLTEKTLWYLWDFGVVPVGGPEGPDNYIHGDIHHVYFHPAHPSQLYFATDGGVFFSGDKGETFEGRNGGYQSTQFYASFANSSTDSSYAMGGMQDNATAIYQGDDAWKRVIGGDGLSASIDPLDDSWSYGSYQYLGMMRSNDRFDTQTDIKPPSPGGGLTSFAGPYELAPSTPQVIYAGRNYLYKSPNRGQTWFQTSANPLDGNNPILTLAVSTTDPNYVIAGVAPLYTPPARIMKSTSGGIGWEDITGSLPDRIPMDIALHPHGHDTMFVAFSGFGSGHLYKSKDGGQSWQQSDSGLPDVPTNTVVIDPVIPSDVYVGNDLGVYYSADGGASWSLWSQGLPDATLVMHLSISPANRKLRVATHGNGVYQAPLQNYNTVSLDRDLAGFKVGKLYPNPAALRVAVPVVAEQSYRVQAALLDMQGRLVRSYGERQGAPGSTELTYELGELSTGIYLLQLEIATADGRHNRKVRRLVVE